MFCSTYLMVFILVNIVQMGSTIIVPACNMRRKPSVTNFNVSQFAGTWYLRSATSLISRYRNLTSYIVEVSSSENNGQTQLDIITKRSFTGRSDCPSFSWSCALQGSTCTIVGLNHSFEILAIQYNNVFAHWSETVDSGETYQILSLYGRDAVHRLYVGRIRLPLRRFCGRQASDAYSAFYAKQFNYSNSPCIA